MKIKLRRFKSSEHIIEKGDESYRGFGYISLFSDPTDLAKWSKKKLLLFCNFQQGCRYKVNCNFASFNRVVVTKTSKIRMRQNINCCLENESKPIIIN